MGSITELITWFLFVRNPSAGLPRINVNGKHGNRKTNQEIVSIGQGRDDSGLRVVAVQRWEEVRFGIYFEDGTSQDVLTDGCKVWKRELKRRIKDDFKSGGLCNGAHGNAIYRLGALQGKRELRVQFQHFPHNIAIINICGHHAVISHQGKNYKFSKPLAQVLTYGSGILWYKEKCMFDLCPGSWHKGFWDPWNLLSYRDERSICCLIHNKPLLAIPVFMRIRWLVAEGP